MKRIKLLYKIIRKYDLFDNLPDPVTAQAQISRPRSASGTVAA